ncbi:MAG: hypothetical protein PVI04_00920, partial [Anaerolineales bacterium]
AFLVAQLAPGTLRWVQPAQNWPLIIIAAAIMLLVIGLLVGEPDMLVPAAVVGGVGGLLYWQSITGRWETWAYAWTLIPGFVGVGVFLARLFEGRLRAAFTEGGQAILISLVLFTVFASFLGQRDFPGLTLPVLLIGAGLLVMINTLLSRSR